MIESCYSKHLSLILFSIIISFAIRYGSSLLLVGNRKQKQLINCAISFLTLLLFS